jgi:D-alanyl-D-alanine carboxypeptidase (penicillin-binding protein 5/6)
LLLGRIKRTVYTGFAVIVALAGATVAFAEVGTPPKPVQVVSAAPFVSNLNVHAVGFQAPAAALIDANTGQLLYANNILAKRYPASIAKLMTALLALQLVREGKLTLQSIIPVSQSAYNVARTPGLSVAYLNPSEHITLERMLKYMFVVSADDAAVAVADSIAGNQRAFARMMNAEAAKLGMTGTHYVNASGLQSAQEYTNALDTLIIARHLILRYPIVLKYASLPGMYIHPGQYGVNYDYLLGQFPGLDGLKTGSTNQAGFCFVGTAIRGKTRLISVIFGASSFNAVFQDTAALLDYGFNHFASTLVQRSGVALAQRVQVANGVAASIQVAPRADISLKLPKTGARRVSFALTEPRVRAPIRAGEQVGSERIAVNGHVVLNAPVYALQSDNPAGLMQKAWRWVFYHIHRAARRVVDRALHKLGEM